MSDSSDNEDVHCPVCREHSMKDNLQAQGVVITGIKALLDGDEATIRNVFESLTPYDGHTAIGLSAALLHDLSLITNQSADEFLNHYRKMLNDAQAKAD